MIAWGIKNIFFCYKRHSVEIETFAGERGGGVSKCFLFFMGVFLSLSSSYINLVIYLLLTYLVSCFVTLWIVSFLVNLI